ncbi:unnamed protein product [Dicrocoelium dendriticum]|nr:unnamed protein product [Dicrocoelium dendriticum]
MSETGRKRTKFSTEIRKPLPASTPGSKVHSECQSPYRISDDTKSTCSAFSDNNRVGQKPVSGRKLRARLQGLLRSKVVKQVAPLEREETELPIQSIFGRNEPSTSLEGIPFNLIPPLPHGYTKNESQLQPEDPNYVGTRDQCKASTKAFPNAVFGSHSAHKRSTKHAPSSTEEPEHHSSTCYQHHHLVIREKRTNATKPIVVPGRTHHGYHQHRHHHSKSHQKSHGTERLESVEMPTILSCAELSASEDGVSYVLAKLLHFILISFHNLSTSYVPMCVRDGVF